MNFLRQGFRKYAYYRHMPTYVHSHRGWSLTVCDKALLYLYKHVMLMLITFYFMR